MTQRGRIWKGSRSWYGQWRQDEIERGPDGADRLVRVQRSAKLAEISDRYRTKKDVQPILDAKLRSLNLGTANPQSTLSIADYVERHYLPFAETELKRSTAYGYRNIWRIYLKPYLTKTTLRDFRCVDATNLLASIHREHELGKKSLRHCKTLLGVIFKHAKRSGVIDGESPIKDCGIPRAAKESSPTHAYSPDEVLVMLGALDGVARTAVALMYFCGLRPGEARAIRWEDFDGKTLRIRHSMWRKHLSDPKTADSIAPVPVAETLALILAETKKERGYILTSPTGSPVDLHNLAYRVVVPALSRCVTCGNEKKDHAGDHEFAVIAKWHGWYALRRGLATLAASVDSRMAAKSLLRHSNIATTDQFYIKTVAADGLRAVEKIDALFQTSNGAQPN